MLLKYQDPTLIRLIDSMFLTKTEIQIIIALTNEYLYVGNILHH